ncbi:hypothetical protein HMPREF3293_01102 [Christensenella minuta]|uniref:Uncharacterized protein n=1 Tax=Christensenella minuta TaxID=626937 RepID=A0A136Q640_9FIRM|nr:hypothetical protein HMPREF3293_01102 [Christensenella minuta]
MAYSQPRKFPDVDIPARAFDVILLTGIFPQAVLACAFFCSLCS